eukprot:gene754-biopygen3398
MECVRHGHGDGGRQCLFSIAPVVVEMKTPHGMPHGTPHGAPLPHGAPRCHTARTAHTAPHGGARTAHSIRTAPHGAAHTAHNAARRHMVPSALDDPVWRVAVPAGLRTL